MTERQSSVEKCLAVIAYLQSVIDAGRDQQWTLRERIRQLEAQLAEARHD